MKRVSSILLIAMLAGCATKTPKDYWQDTTPEHNGSHWIGGQ